MTGTMKGTVLDLQALSDLATGCALLGSGGGGDPANTLLELAELGARTEGGIQVTLLPGEALADSDTVAPCGWIGAPTVSLEKLPSGREALAGLRKLEEILGRKVDAVCPVEVGGSNGLSPFLLAARTGLPVVDCDGMGRAFPESQMVIFNVHGISASPAVLTDSKGSSVAIDAADNDTEELVARAAAVALGGNCHLFEYIQSGRQIKDFGIHGTISIAVEIGRAIRQARQQKRDPVAALLQVLRSSSCYGHAGVLFDGKITDLQRDTRNGFAVGYIVLENFGGTQRMEVEFQNENLIARLDGRICATVPDIITIVDRETAHPVTTEQLQYGQRVKVVGASPPPVLRMPAALGIMGPAAFGLGEVYTPIEQLNHWQEIAVD